MLSLTLRILLVLMSILTFIYMIRKLRKEQLQTLDMLFWTLFAMTILIMSLFPEFVVACTDYIGVQSSVNFVYLVIFFFLIIRIFLLNVRVSKLETKLNEYVINMAVKSCDEKEQKNE